MRPLARLDGIAPLLALALAACASAGDDELATDPAAMVAAASSRAVMDAYFAAWMGGVDAGALHAVLAPDVRVELAGMPAITSADAYVTALTAGPSAVSCRQDRFVQKLYAGDFGSFVYECDTPGGPLPFVENLTVRHGRVARSVAVADMTRIAAAGASAAAVRAIGTKVLEPRDANGYDAVFAEDVIVHTGGRDLDREAFKAFTRSIFAALPDFQEHLHVVEANADGAVAVALVTGTHTGAPFLGLPATGRRIAFTVTHVYRTRAGKIVEDWSQADLAGAMAQLTSNVSAPTMDELEASLARADAEASLDCPAVVTDPVSETIAERWKAAVPYGHEAASNALFSPHFRFSFGGALLGDAADSRERVGFVRQLGTIDHLTDLRVRYLGNRVVAMAGNVAFAYLNPTGVAGLPKTTSVKHVQTGEVHVLRVCGGKVTRQISNVDALGLATQAARP